MSTLKDALARVTRVVRNYESLRHTKKPSVLLPTQLQSPKHTVKPARPRIPRSDLNQIRPHIAGYLRKRYQKFLAPLDMPNLKVYEENPRPFDRNRAELNLANKKSEERLQIFANYLGEREVFAKMVDLLVELTPEDLKSEEIVQNPVSLSAVLDREDQAFHDSRYDDVPQFHFREVPPMPHPLTKENFQKYIYFLTHSKVLYRNSSSLLSGIIPEILLRTHHLENTKYKDFRSAETYNYLIKFFGYDKFQSSFARELLLVMVKDGHEPNINTINQLLKMCRVHTRRRSIVSTYKVAITFISLVKKLDLRLSLAIWNRVYDCIDNIFLKEAFLNKISAVNLPVSSNLCIQVLNDYSQTTKDTDEVITFLESDLCRNDWRQNPRMAEKILSHKIRHMSENKQLGEVFENMIPKMAVDALTIKIVANAIEANPKFDNKGYLVFCTYHRLGPKTTLVPPEVYGRVIKLLCSNKDNYHIPALTFFTRGVLHHDATRMLNLPVETIEYEKQGRFVNNARKSRTAFPYAIPHALFSEHYKIMKRLSRAKLNVLEAKVIHYKNRTADKEMKYPWEPLSEEEEQKWADVVDAISCQEKFWEQTSEKAGTAGLIKASVPQAPEAIIASYERYHHIQMRVSNEIDTVNKLRTGLDEYLTNEMKERDIRSDDPNGSE